MLGGAGCPSRVVCLWLSRSYPPRHSLTAQRHTTPHISFPSAVTRQLLASLSTAACASEVDRAAVTALQARYKVAPGQG